MSSTKYDNSDNSFVERLELLKGVRRQKEFAEWLDESVTTVNGYFTGQSKPQRDFLMKLSQRGVNVNWFLTGDGPMYTSQMQAGELPANIQTLIHELDGWSTMTDDLIELVRAKKKVIETEEKVKAMFRRKKK